MNFRTLLIGLAAAAALSTSAVANAAVRNAEAPKPRLIVTTDINIKRGDPSDRQTLAYLMLHLDQVDLRGIVADRSPEGEAVGALRACHLVVDAYAHDFAAPGVQFRELGFPAPHDVRRLITPGGDEAVQLIVREGRRDDPRPLFVIAWGNLHVLRRALDAAPDIAPKLRVVSIETWSNPKQPNRNPHANAAGRDAIVTDPRFADLWWLEIDNVGPLKMGLVYPPKEKDAPQPAPVSGPGVDLFNEITKFGSLGRHFEEVTEGIPWSRFFKATDVPSLFYLLDPDGVREDPSQPSWAGVFERPLPKRWPNHWTERTYGKIDHENPEATVGFQLEVWKRRLEEVTATGRPAAFDALRRKLRAIYGER